MISEEATKQVSIRPFIEALGYDTSNLDEVEPEYVADARSRGGERVDYAIKRGGKPVVLIETKSASTVLIENHWKQLHSCFNADEVRFGILSNGITYQFYTDLKKRNIMDREPFLVIDMLNLNERLAEELDGFTKSNFDPARILSNAQKLAVLQLLSNELKQPSEDFMMHFAEVKRVGGGEMAKSNNDRVGEIMDLLKSGLGPYVLLQYKFVHKSKYLEELELQLYDGGTNISLPGELKRIDTQGWLKVIFYSWNEVFKEKLGHSERSYVSLLMEARNKWAHQVPFTNDDAQHVAYIARRLLEVVNATDEAAQADRHNNELARLKYEREARNAAKHPPKATDAPLGQAERDNLPTLPPTVPTIERTRGVPPKPREPRLIQDNAYPARQLFEWGTKKAKGFIKNRRGSVRIYDAAGEKHFWVEDEEILVGTCYQAMEIEISTGHRVENDYPPPAKRLVNVIPEDERFEFDYEFRGSGRYVVTGIR